jgi:protein-S-isoprenylcysteine O-methyltransferase Ste14
MTMLKRLVGSGDKIMLVVLPFLIGCLILNVAFPEFFAVGGPPAWLAAVSAVVLIVGVVVWLWSVYLILTRVPRDELITTGPYALVRHPLYTGVALLVLPWVGFLLNTWLGVVLGIVLYVADRMFAPAEDAALAARFGTRWQAYSRSVLMPWI